MDHKTWHWKKRSSEKSIPSADKVNLCESGNEEKIQNLQRDKEELEREIKNLSEKLSSALSECNTRDDLAKRNAKMAKEALGGWEKVESEAMLLKQQLDEVLTQNIAGEERRMHLDMALKECMQKLRFVREEKELRIREAVTKTSREFEQTRAFFEENLANTNKKLSKLSTENAQFAKVLVAKEKLIEDINAQKARLEADFNALVTRLESTEKENASLKYEVRVFEKEIEIRNEEREFRRRAADSEHKQHLENSKKIANLESECRRLRGLVRKQLPGPAALAKMKSEVEIFGKDSIDPRRRKSNLSPTGTLEFVTDQVPDTVRRKIDFLEEENRCLKEALEKQNSELKFSQAMYNHTASKLSQMTLMSEFASEDKVSTPGSRASILFSESNHFQSGEEEGTLSRKSTVGASEIDLMDDFVEMEKLATLSRNKLPIQTDVSKAVQKVIDLIEGIVNYPEKNRETPGYTARVFQWKTCELGTIIQKFIQTCNELLTGKADLDSFVLELSSALDWVINHCFSLQDVSSMRYAIKEQFECDENVSEIDKLRFPREQFPYSPMSVWSEQIMEEKEDCYDIEEGNKKVKKSLNKDLFGGLQSEIGKTKSLNIQIQESEKNIKNSKTSEMMIQNQISHHMVDEKLEEKGDCCKEVEATCMKSRLQLERTGNEENPKEALDQDIKQLESDLEIASASEKLAECQETILNLGRQFKALASPQTPQNKSVTVTPHVTLLDKMLAEDKADNTTLKIPKTEEVISVSDPQKTPSRNNETIENAKNNADENIGSFMTLVPSKKKGSGGLLKKLLGRKKKGR